MKKIKIKDLLGNLFKEKTPKQKTVRKAIDFCIVQTACLVISIYGLIDKQVVYCMLAILTELFEFRFFSLSIRLRRFEEEIEEKAILKSKKTK